MCCMQRCKDTVLKVANIRRTDAGTQYERRKDASNKKSSSAITAVSSSEKNDIVLEGTKLPLRLKYELAVANRPSSY